MDSGQGQRLERFGSVIVQRPDNQCIWQPQAAQTWRPQLSYSGKAGEGSWQGQAGLLSGWEVQFEQAPLWAIPTPFRHLGIFPEQQPQWDWIAQQVKAGKKRVLNLFAYTGAASVVAAKAGATVTHVDSSRPSIRKAKQNAALGGPAAQTIRWIEEDARAFLAREIRRGNQYDVIVLDPPVFGRGSKGSIWRLEEGITGLLEQINQVAAPGYGLWLTFYATTLYPESMYRLVRDYHPVELGRTMLRQVEGETLLQTGYCLRSL
jgi:23S rRNA (cytosine1962-C5)-methyltransferase